MPISADLALFERNTDIVEIAVTRVADDEPEDLSGVTVEVYFKLSADADDADVTTTKLVTPDDVTITDAAAGMVQFLVPAAVVAEPGQLFWRCDLVDGANRRTATYGAVTIKNL